MSVVLSSLKNNTAFIAILLIDLLLAAWSCEREAARISNQLEIEKSRKVVQISHSDTITNISEI